MGLIRAEKLFSATSDTGRRGLVANCWRQSRPRCFEIGLHAASVLLVGGNAPLTSTAAKTFTVVAPYPIVQSRLRQTQGLPRFARMWVRWLPATISEVTWLYPMPLRVGPLAIVCRD